MSHGPLVSAVIIFYDAERFLNEAIESVYAQTYRAWELLLVDDGSTDGSTTLARRHARERPARVRYLEHPGHENRGMSAARNLGLAHAQGSYVGFLDADDLWLPDKLAEQVEILTTQPEAGMVYGRTKIWYGWTGEPADQRRDGFYALGVEPDRLYAPPVLFRLLLENRYQTPTTCNALIRSSVFDRIGGFEDMFRGMYEDQTFFAKLMLQEPVFVASRTWALYRQHAGSYSERTASRHIEQRTTFLNWIADYLERVGAPPALRRALRFEVWKSRHPRAAWCLAWLRAPWQIVAGRLGRRGDIGSIP